MFTKRKNAAEEPKEEAFDVSSMLGTYEENPHYDCGMIWPSLQKELPGGSPSSGCYASTLSHAGNALEERLKEDLKMSYEASGILDVTFGGYGSLSKEYAINPNEDIASPLPKSAGFG